MRESAERMRKAEKEIGENLPQGMIGLDTEDVGEIKRHGKGAQETPTKESSG